MRRRRTGAFARDNPTYYSLMFDRVVPDFEPSPSAPSRRPSAALGRVVDRVQRAMDAGAIRAGRPVRGGVGAVGVRPRAWRRSRPARPTGARRAVRLGRHRPDRRSTRCCAGWRPTVIPVRVRAPGGVGGRRSSSSTATAASSVASALGRDGDAFVGEVRGGHRLRARRRRRRPAVRPVEGAARPVGDRGVVPARSRPRAGPRRGVDNAGRGPLAVARRPPGAPRRPRRRGAATSSTRPTCAGCTRLADVDAPGTFAALVGQLPRLAAPRRHRHRAAAGAPERSAGGQLLGLHAAGVRRRPPPVRRRRRPRRASWPTFVAAAHDARHRGVARRRVQPHDRGRRQPGPTYSQRGPRRRARSTGCAPTARTSRRPGAATTSTSRRRSPRTSCCGRSTASPTSASTASASTSPPCSPTTSGSSHAMTSVGAPARAS